MANDDRSSEPIELAAIILTKSNCVIGFRSVEAARAWMAENPRNWEIAQTATSWTRESKKCFLPQVEEHAPCKL